PASATLAAKPPIGRITGKIPLGGESRSLQNLWCRAAFEAKCRDPRYPSGTALARPHFPVFAELSSMASPLPPEGSGSGPTRTTPSSVLLVVDSLSELTCRAEKVGINKSALSHFQLAPSPIYHLIGNAQLDIGTIDLVCIRIMFFELS